MQRQSKPAVLRRDVQERLRKVRAKFAELKYHDLKPNRRLPDITEVVQVIATRLGLAESTLWSDKAPYLMELKRLLSVWQTELDELQSQEGLPDTSSTKAARTLSKQQALDALSEAQQECRLLTQQLGEKARLVKLLEAERKVLEAELDQLRAANTALERTLAHLRATQGPGMGLTPHQSSVTPDSDENAVRLGQALEQALGRAEKAKKTAAGLRLQLLGKKVVKLRDRIRRVWAAGRPSDQTGVD